VAGGIAFAATTAIFMAPHPDWGYSLMTGGAYGAMIFIACAFLGNADGSQLKIPPPDKSRRGAIWWSARYASARHWRLVIAGLTSFCVFGILIGTRFIVTPPSNASGGMLTSIASRTGFYVGLDQGLVLLVLTFIVAGVPAAPPTVRSSDFSRPARSVGRAFFAALALGGAFGILWGATAVLKNQHPGQMLSYANAIPTALITGVDFAIGAWLFRWSRTWFTQVRSSSPRSAARKDLAGSLIRPFILAATFAFGFGISAPGKVVHPGHINVTLISLPVHITPVDFWAWFVVGFVLGTLDSEWPLYLVSITLLALKRKPEDRLPLRLMRFLESCRACGILRVIGQEYQIHDVDLLKHLVTPDPNRTGEDRNVHSPRPGIGQAETAGAGRG
jgi:hypothetical protein